MIYRGIGKITVKHFHTREHCDILQCKAQHSICKSYLLKRHEACLDLLSEISELTIAISFPNNLFTLFKSVKPSDVCIQKDRVTTTFCSLHRKISASSDKRQLIFAYPLSDSELSFKLLFKSEGLLFHYESQSPQQLLPTIRIT